MFFCSSVLLVRWLIWRSFVEHVGAFLPFFLCSSHAVGSFYDGLKTAKCKLSLNTGNFD